MDQRFRDGAVAGSWTAPLIPPVELALGIAWFAWIALAWFAKDRKGGWFKTVLLVCMLAAALSLPALAWNHSQWLPGVLTIPMFLLLGKTWELASGSFSGFGRLDTPTGFVLWAVVCPKHGAATMPRFGPPFEKGRGSSRFECWRKSQCFGLSLR
jgi:hypothetical protein